ncbi:uncharacterized protein ATC70_012996 [Mucor velutinosus]|uniref:Helitron helicase-like domain-containing protein n=1 Tax=Mucor velutinosus TaxID=708070 RepID=A0AAN7HYS7_9FUNG|nr:hypothetical protein ATC70_012996 [Mucor velutinosus]
MVYFVCTQIQERARNYARQRRLANRRTPRAPAAFVSELGRVQRSDLGRMDNQCDGCGALHWAAERAVQQRVNDNCFHACCKKGRAVLPLLQEPPEPLNSLINGSHPRSSHFLQHMRQYNTLFAFTSFGTDATPEQLQRDRENEMRGGITPVRVHGELYHLQAPLNLSNVPKYSQLYVYDPEYAAAIRCADPRNQGLDDTIIEQLSEMIAAIIPNESSDRCFRDTVREKNVPVFCQFVVLHLQLCQIFSSFKTKVRLQKLGFLATK